MSNIHFAGWVIQDSEGVLLKIVAPEQPTGCDACGGYAVYDVVLPDGGVSPMCQGCLDMSYEDPQSPDLWFAPVPKGTVPTTYSNGDQQIVVNLPR